MNEPFSFGIKILTEPFPSTNGIYNFNTRGSVYLKNALPDWDGEVTIAGNSDYTGPHEYSFAGGHSTYSPKDTQSIRRIGPLSFTQPGVKYLTVTDKETRISGISNPVMVANRPPAEHLYWGDIHSQTYFSDGLRNPEQLHSFARDEAFLDVFALSDHAECLTDRQWEYFVNITNDFYEPGRFVTFVGSEWSSKKWGHRNVYYPGDSGPIMRSNDPVFSELPKVFETARKHRALVIPHHTASQLIGADWSLGEHDSEVERLVEIYSCWGNSECHEDEGNTRPIRACGGEKRSQHVIDALKGGYRFGIIGGGDIHDGRPGDDLHFLQRSPQDYRLTYRQGIVGLWAKDLTREGIWDALWNRRVYATTNVRVILRFQINGKPMGSEIMSEGKQHISVEAYSDVPISQVDLIRNGENFKSIHPGALEVRWNSEDTLRDASWYYVRLMRADEEMAWSSPIWVSR